MKPIVLLTLTTAVPFTIAQSVCDTTTQAQNCCNALETPENVANQFPVLGLKLDVPGGELVGVGCQVTPACSQPNVLACCTLGAPTLSGTFNNANGRFMLGCVEGELQSLGN